MKTPEEIEAEYVDAETEAFLNDKRYGTQEFCSGFRAGWDAALERSVKEDVPIDTKKGG